VSAVEAGYYDGHSARWHRVRLSVVPGGFVLIDGEGWQRTVRADELKIGERLGGAPRRLNLPDGALCEIPDPAGADALLAQLGHRGSAVERLQASWPIAAVSVVLMLGVMAASYRWGLPLAARLLAPAVPEAVLEAMSSSTLRTLDAHLLQPSALRPERQQQLAADFAALRKPGAEALSHEIVFRGAPRLGPNAMALPDGQLVVLDELVALADHDEQLLAVLAHELGHVHLHHSLRLLIQTTLVGAAMAWWVGDFSALLAAAPTVLMQTRYSRELEAEADAYAATLLRANRLRPERLAEMLEKLQAAHSAKTAPRAEGDEEGEGDWLDYLSTHPATQERIRALRSG
jgi:Zn-dependent protease with chaperone function